MRLPHALQLAIEEETRSFKGSDLALAYEELSSKYRDSSQRHTLAGSGKQFMGTPSQRTAYINARMPATFAVLQHIFKEIIKRNNAIPITSLLDLGAGPGTAMWAAAEVFSGLQIIRLIEQDEQMIAIGQRLARFSTQPVVQQALWEKENLLTPAPWTPHDLVVVSYVLGELPEKQQTQLFEQSWEAAKQALVFVEPGTPDGFRRILSIRQRGLALGAQMIAPCPGTGNCPLPSQDWCHFSERVERTSSHRQMKKGLLGHEDEKFSYIVLGKSPAELPLGRILRHPGKHAGHVTLQLCTAEGLQPETVSKRDGSLYKQARKADWGDAWPPK